MLNWEREYNEGEKARLLVLCSKKRHNALNDCDSLRRLSALLLANQLCFTYKELRLAGWLAGRPAEEEIRRRERRDTMQASGAQRKGAGARADS